ncbi:MAG: aspartate-semialdehyde dehydrogenase [Myxococcales bacterium]|nr:aspartate-semialdehyde dehydrogenase [Myxococcales bacterium]
MRTGFVGWRGMVGSVLRQRMLAEGDFTGLDPVFFSTSAAGGAAPDVGQGPATLLRADDVAALAGMDVILTCQGGDWTHAMYPRLRAAGWDGVFIDASSALRTADEATLVLDPVNRPVIDAALAAGCRTFVGPNCTVSLMLMGLVGLFRAGLVEWVSTMTYQAASGAGAAAMRELVAQMVALGQATAGLDPAGDILDLDAVVSATLASEGLPTQVFQAPLAGSAIPWVDRLVDGGQTREEWKGGYEANKIMGLRPPVPVDGICVRIGAMRCHAQAVTIKLTEAVPLATLERLIAEAHPWVDVVPNTPEATRAQLTPAATAGSLRVPVGRLRALAMGPEYLTAFTVGDQLLWGAAEPLRRMLAILRGRL